VQLPSPFYTLDEHFAIELPGARAVFTTRRGGVSRGAFASLNLGLKTDDAPENVQENRARVAERLDARLSFVRQVHGITIRPAGGPDVPEGDGQVSTVPGVAPAVLVADCLPVVVAAPGAVVVLHAGWRGLAGGIVAAGVRALRAAGAGEAFSAAIGPGAGGCCYEVGDEVHAAFAGYGSAVRHGRNLDLKAIARADLEAAGAAEVHDIGLCTLCADAGLFFSHRRDGGVTGRQAGLAWLS
jgi:YfiH family protein